jgi:hypothetical protein
MQLTRMRFIITYLIILCSVLSSCNNNQLNQEKQPVLEPSPSYTVPPDITPTSTPSPMPKSTLTLIPTVEDALYPTATLHPECGTVTLGKAGTQTELPAKGVLLQGTAILCGDVELVGIFQEALPVLQAMFDLDTGTFDLDSADIQFCPGGGTDIFYYFCNVKSSFIKEYSFFLSGDKVKTPEQPSWDECRNVDTPYSRTTDNEPAYVCVRTDKGHIARIKVEQYNPLGEAVMALEISFVTLEK